MVTTLGVFTPIAMVAEAPLAVVGSIAVVAVVNIVWVVAALANARVERLKRERRAQLLIDGFDSHETDLEDAIENERGEAGLLAGGIAGPQPKPKRLRFRRQKAQEVAFGLADAAYFQFGPRVKTQANEMITYKFMRDLIGEYKDLRKRDQKEILAAALHLSFVPSRTWQVMNELAQTEVFKLRSELTVPEPRWWWPFQPPVYRA